MIEPIERSIDLRKIEEEVQKFWQDNKIYEKQKEKIKNGKKYYFLDGPPYASGSIHLGTAWNKIIKDTILRFLALNGYNVRRQAGWDTHGLPIEVKVEKELGIINKREIEEKIGVENFIKACKDFALRHVEIMTRQFKRLGVWLDWDKPYMTLTDDYIESAWWTIRRAYEKGLLVRDFRVITTCPRCETALADAEIEYKNVVDPSIYVKFKVAGRENEYIVIWTTTPWTLIANLAISVHPEIEYAKVETKEGILILAKDLVHIVKDKFGLDYKIVEIIKGKELEGLRYEHPLKEFINIKPKSEKAYTVILADFVTLGEGTGCVHTAPGHGPEDFEACKKYGIEAICPVDERGVFTEEAGKYAGLKVKREDNVIIEDLEKVGALLYKGTIVHRYGHCWRCKTPIIYRATEQWFIKITELKEKMLEEIERVEWIPEWAGSARFRDWIKNAKDWTISRQRFWGIPLPVWICEKCGAIEVISSKKELEEKSGAKIEELHRPYVDKAMLKCKCGGDMKRVKDVLDVWFDSGVAAWASLSYPKKKEEFEKWYPVDFITEGHDQTRGWFYSQLGCGLIALDEVPYRRVLMHGFTLDEKGEKMSKSLGNVIAPEEVIERYGADVLRFYVLWANKPWEDLKFNWKEVDVVNKMFTVLWNVFVFATTYMSLDKFDPLKHGFSTETLSFTSNDYLIEDKWIVSKINSLIEEVSEEFNNLQLQRVTRKLYDFILEDLSRWYITLIRPRTWIEHESKEKTAAYKALFETLSKLLVLLAPIVPHISEYLYQRFLKPFTKKESIHLENWVKAEKEKIDKELENDMIIVREIIDAVASAREKARIKRRWPVKRIILKTEDNNVIKAAENLKELIKRQANTLNFEIVEKFGKKKLLPNMPALGKEFRSKAKELAKIIESLSEDVIPILEKGYEIEINGEKVVIKKEHVKIVEELPENIVSESFTQGTVYIDTEKDEEILSLGYAREIVRRIQEMRKELDLNIEAYIEARVEVEEEIARYLESQKDYIARETRAKILKIGKVQHEGYKKEWKIGNIKAVISIKEIK